MNIADYLSVHQSPVYNLFLRAKKDQRWSHAYLLDGDAGQPLLEIAQFLAQSLLCEQQDTLACGSCLTCQRFLNNDYTDIQFVDGREQSIKKQDVLDLANRFSITGLEKANKLIYVLHHVEAMTPEAINALLKFLEEPQLDIYALLTTTSLESVLSTIQSRSQLIHLKPTQHPALIQQAIKQGLTESVAQMLGYECATIEELMARGQDPLVLQSLAYYETFLNKLATSSADALYYFRHTWLPELDNLEAVRTFLHRWIRLLTDLGNVSNHQAIKLKAYVSMLLGIAQRIHDPYHIVLALTSRLARVHKSTNLPLFLEAVMIEFIGELHD